MFARAGGEVVYRHADRLYTMPPGHSLLLDADVPHGPEELAKLRGGIVEAVDLI